MTPITISLDHGIPFAWCESTGCVAAKRTSLCLSRCEQRRRNEMTLFSRRAAGCMAAIAGFVLAVSAPCLAQSQDHQDSEIRDTRQLVQSLRAGGYNISSGMARRLRTRRISILLTSITSPNSETSTTKARSWPRRLATQFAGLVCLSERSTRASSIAPTRRPCWQDSRISSGQST